MERIETELGREQMTVQNNTTNEINEKQLLWYGQYEKAGRERLPKKAFRWNSRGRKESQTQRVLLDTKGKIISENLWEDGEEWR